MQFVVRKIGNSVGVTFPAALQRELDVRVGQPLTADIQGGALVPTPPRRPRYSRSDLLAQCDPKAPLPPTRVAWDKLTPKGSEPW